MTEGPPVPRPIAAGWPPPPHDPRERECVRTLSGWELRVFRDGKVAYFAPRGLWHAQLWHPEAGVSILTPSRLTRGAYEIFPIRGWKERAADFHELSATVADEHGVLPPDLSVMIWIERTFVQPVARACRSTPIAL